MFGVVAVVVEIQIAVGVEHGVVQVKVYAFQTAVHPVGRQIHTVFVGSCSSAVVAVEGVEKSVVAVQPQVAVGAKTVEFLVWLVAGGGGLPALQAAANAVLLVYIGAVGIAYVVWGKGGLPFVEAAVAVIACLAGGCVAGKVGLAKAVLLYLATVAVGYTKGVGLWVGGAYKLVCAVVGKVFRKGLVWQPRVAAHRLRYVARGVVAVGGVGELRVAVVGAYRRQAAVLRVVGVLHLKAVAVFAAGYRTKLVIKYTI